MPGAAGTPVTGAVAGLNRTNQAWWLLGTGTQYDTQQDHLKAKIAYDITPALRASYTFGWWDNSSQGNVATYLRDAAGNPVYSGSVNIEGRSFTLLPSDFAPTPREPDALHARPVPQEPYAAANGTGSWRPAATTITAIRCALPPPRCPRRPRVAQAGSWT